MELLRDGSSLAIDKPQQKRIEKDYRNDNLSITYTRFYNMFSEKKVLQI